MINEIYLFNNNHQTLKGILKELFAFFYKNNLFVENINTGCLHLTTNKNIMQNLTTNKNINSDKRAG